MEVSWRLRGPGLASVVRWRWSVSNLLVATRVKEQPAAAGLAANQRAAARFTSRSCCQDPGRPWPTLASPLNWGRYILDSHWSSSYITALSLVESFRVMLRQLSYAIKNQLVASKAPY